MKDRILAVISYAAADDLCRARMHNWIDAVKPTRVLMSGGMNPVWYPKGSYVLHVGADAYPDTAPESRDLNMPLRFTRTLEKALELSSDPMHVEVCLIEPDVWFWRSPFEGNNTFEGFNGKQFQEADGRSFWHWPYTIRGTGQARALSHTCRALLRYRASCCPWGSFPDRFVGLALDVAQLPTFNANQVSFNTVETEAQIQECLRAKAAGAFAVHGVKNQQVLERLL